MPGQSNAEKITSTIPGVNLTLFTPVPAVRRRQRASLGIMGPPGSGKTRQSLMVADALRRHDGDERPVLMIDAQWGQGFDEADWWYAQHGNEAGSFVIIDWLAHDPTVHPVPLLRYLRTVGERYSVIVVDPFSRFWEGARDWKSALDSVGYMGGNRFASWGPVDDVWSDLIEWLQKPPCHAIVVARMKERYEQAPGADGKVTSVGLQPQWREETSYELGSTVRLYDPKDHAGKFVYTVERTRGSQPFKPGEPTEKIAETFAVPYGQWLAAGQGTIATAKNPEADARWDEIKGRYRAIPDGPARNTARTELIASGLISQDGAPSPRSGPRFTMIELDVFDQIVTAHSGTVAAPTSAPPPAPAPEVTPEAGDPDVAPAPDDTDSPDARRRAQVGARARTGGET